MNPSPPISETAYYQQELTRARKAQLRRSIGLMVVCGILQGLWLILGALLPLPDILSLDQFLLLSPGVFGLLVGTFIIFGLRNYERSKQPVTMEEASRLRQAERARLFRQAQGVLPATYRPWRLALETLLALLCSGGGMVCLLYSIPASGLLEFAYAACLQVIALYLLYSALYNKPRRARLIPATSARELRRRLALGEQMNETGGQDLRETV